MFCLNSAFAAKYSAEVNVFSNDKTFSRQPFSFYIDFEREVNLSSLKMTVSGDKKTEIPVYAIPVAKYKALIYFIPHKKMPEDSELNYILNFENGKWDAKAVGSNELKAKIKRKTSILKSK